MSDLEVDVTRASRSTVLLHITDSVASRWIELSLDDVEDLAKKLKAALLNGVGYSSRKART